MSEISFYLDDVCLIRCSMTIDDSYQVYYQERSISSVLRNHNEIVLEEAIPFDQDIRVFYKEKHYFPHLRLLSQQTSFENYFSADPKTLGAFYHPQKTCFRLFAPMAEEVKVLLGNSEYLMNYTDKGVWQTEVLGDFHLTEYAYLIKRNNKIDKIIDPFAYIANTNYQKAIIVDTQKLVYPKIILPRAPERKVIYEASVRDFSSSLPCEHAKTFLSMYKKFLKINQQEVGFDYLKNLGVDYLQLMPVHSFVSPGEYNWGYNPLHLSLMEESYFSTKEPYQQIREFQDFVYQCHRAKLRVSLDVVWNHVYLPELFALEKCCPGYFFRYHNTSLSNGSYCGNELRSEAPFLRAYFVMLSERMIRLYDIDGFRFDLMSLLDIETMRRLTDSCAKWKPDFFLYGEGWTLPSALAAEKAASLWNANEVSGVAFFEDHYRNALLPLSGKGFLCDCSLNREEVKKALLGESVYPLHPQQIIHYIECHDGMTVFDRLYLYDGEKNTNILQRKAILGIALLLFSGCSILLHSGQEFLRTKHFCENSYDAGDDINTLSWQRRIDFSSAVETIKEMLSLAKNIRFIAQREIFDYYEIIGMKMNNYTFLFNACPYTHIYPFVEDKILLFDGEKQQMTPIKKAITISAFSFVLLQDII